MQLETRVPVPRTFLEHQAIESFSTRGQEGRLQGAIGQALLMIPTKVQHWIIDRPVGNRQAERERERVPHINHLELCAVLRAVQVFILVLI